MPGWIVISLLALFAVGMLLITLYSVRVSSKTVDDYLVASRTIGLIAFFFYSSFGIISTWTIYGYPGFMSFNGIPFNVYHLSSAFGIALVTYYLIGYRLHAVGRLYNFLSPLEAIADRYGSPTLRLLMAVILTVFIMPYIGLQFSGMGAGIREASSDVSYNLGAFFMLCVCILYIGLGGLRSAAWVNIMLGVLAVGTLIGTFVGLYTHLPGGLVVAAQVVLERNPMLLSMPGPTGYFTTPVTIGLALGGFFYFAPHMLIGLMGVKSKKTISLMVGCFPVLCAVIYTLCMIMGALFAPVLSPGITGKAADAIIQIMTSKYLPRWWSVIFLMGVLSYGISTAALQLLAAGTFFVNDIYKAFINPKAGYRQVQGWNFVFLTVLSLGSFGFALWRPTELARYLSDIAGPGFTMVLPLIVAAFYWPRATKQGAIAGLCAGTAYLAYGILVDKTVFFGAHPIVVPLILNVALLVVVSLLTPPPSEEIKTRWYSRVNAYLFSEKSELEYGMPKLAADSSQGKQLNI